MTNDAWITAKLSGHNYRENKSLHSVIQPRQGQNETRLIPPVYSYHILSNGFSRCYGGVSSAGKGGFPRRTKILLHGTNGAVLFKVFFHLFTVKQHPLVCITTKYIVFVGMEIHSVRLRWVTWHLKHSHEFLMLRAPGEIFRNVFQRIHWYKMRKFSLWRCSRQRCCEWDYFHRKWYIEHKVPYVKA